MSLESLKENIMYEKEMLAELLIFRSQLEQARFLRNKQDEAFLTRTINALLNLLKITNDSIPRILEAGYEKVEKDEEPQKEKKKEEKLIRISYSLPTGRRYVTITKKNEAQFLKDLSLTFGSIKKLKRNKKEIEPALRLFKKPSFYAKLSNKLFSRLSNKLVNKGYFKKLNLDMRRANMPFLLNTYLSIGFMTALIGLVLGIIMIILLILIFPSYSIYSLVLPLIPAAILAGFYFYPVLEKGNIESRINQELPFVVIHMSAIAGSGIEPSQIFKIIALSEEYKNTRQELKKVINQINVYGYDLITALKNAARSTASKKLAELFNGLSTTISGGGSLIDFLDKRAETLLFDYRLERERFTRTAETFMDIYISVVIAAPMIMMLMLVLLSITGIGIGLSIQALTLIILLVVALINILFLVFLHLKQPGF